MASAFTHAAAALALGTAFRRPGPPGRFWIAGAVCAVAPDLDGIGFWLGVPYRSVLGHRGVTHSLLFAATLAVFGLLAVFRDERWRGERARIWLFLCLATASHGILDAMTTGGGGVAFFAPIVNERYFLPWRPILVSPMSVRRFFTARGAAIIANEVVWVWIPAAAFAVTAVMLRRRRESAKARPAPR